MNVNFRLDLVVGQIEECHILTVTFVTISDAQYW